VGLGIGLESFHNGITLLVGGSSMRRKGFRKLVFWRRNRRILKLIDYIDKMTLELMRFQAIKIMGHTLSISETIRIRQLWKWLNWLKRINRGMHPFKL
jgi:hypothetical protein